MPKNKLDPLGEDPDELDVIDETPATAEVAPVPDATAAAQHAHAELLEKVSDLEATVLELTAERDDLKKHVASLAGVDDGNGPYRLTKSFRACGGFGYLSLEANTVVDDPVHIQILKEHGAKMVLA